MSIPYDDCYLKTLFGLAVHGLSESEICKVLGIPLRTLDAWKTRPQVKEALREGRYEADAKVVAAMYDKAKGYKAKGVKVFYNSKTGEPVIVEHEEYFQPDVVAAKFWLTNRRPDKWRDKPEATETDNKLVINITRFTDPPVLENGNKSTAQLETETVSDTSLAVLGTRR